MRLDKYLSDSGLCTRKEAKKLAYTGHVKVNDEIILNAYFEVYDKDIVTVDGIIAKLIPHRYYMMNKPQGVITATKSEIKQTIFDLMDVNTKGLFPVGRLDRDTEGLVLITSDGDLNHRLLEPFEHADKTYYVELKRPLEKQYIEMLEKGIKIRSEKEICLPCKIQMITENTLFITLHEGKYHQIKKMMMASRNIVTYLKRISIGSLVLDENLKPGEYRPLTQEEINDLKAY